MNRVHGDYNIRTFMWKFLGYLKKYMHIHGMQRRDGHCSERVYKPKKRNHQEKAYLIYYTYAAVTDPLKEKQLRH